ncbi:hypothetical protein R7Z48_11970 [Vibrio sp. 1567]|uniref:hypothetical protein n=1 Tax=Vibrio sp. 1567 TaxID=3074564 RepID=UPI002963E8DB|nr:hypothetical protein [Vibrio sp. 1567]MDW2170145.1 hypothetical protein [Vibrio sp. 1567]
MMDWNWSIVGSGILGSLVGAFVAIFSVYVSHKLNVGKDEKAQTLALLNYKQALHDELDVFWKAYKQGIGNKLSISGDNFILNEFYPEIDAPFAIYEGNVGLLGKIKDPDLRRLIVKAYSEIKALLAQLSLHNQLLLKYEEAHWKNAENSNEHTQAKYESIKDSVYASTKILASKHKESELSVEKLLREFNKHDVLSS